MNRALKVSQKREYCEEKNPHFIRSFNSLTMHTFSLEFSTLEQAMLVLAVA